MTWKEFKEWAEANGVKDDDNIEWMDCGSDPEQVAREQSKDGEWYISIN